MTPTPKPGESGYGQLLRSVATTVDEDTAQALLRAADDIEGFLTQQSQDRVEQEVLADAVVRLVNGGLNASVHMPSHERHAFRRWLSTFSDLAASPGKGAEGEAGMPFVWADNDLIPLDPEAAPIEDEES